MNAHRPDRPFSDAMVRTWDEALAGAKVPEGLPVLRARAEAVNDFALSVYDFAYRADSQVTHSSTWALVSHVQGRLQLSSTIPVANAYGTALLLLGSGAEALQSDAMGRQAKRIQDAMNALQNRRKG